MKFVNCATVGVWAVILASLAPTVSAQSALSSPSRSCRARSSATPSKTRCKASKITTAAPTSPTTTATGLEVGLAGTTTVIILTTVTICPVTLTHVNNGVTAFEVTQTLSTILSTVTSTCPPGAPSSASSNLFSDTMVSLPLTTFLETAFATSIFGPAAVPSSSTPVLAAAKVEAAITLGSSSATSTKPETPAQFTGSGSALSVGNKMLMVAVGCSLFVVFCL